MQSSSSVTKKASCEFHMDLRPKNNVHVENWHENNFTVDPALRYARNKWWHWFVGITLFFIRYYIVIIYYYNTILFGHGRVISFYLYYTFIHTEDTSALFGYRTRYTFTLYCIISSLLLFIRAHRTADDTVLLEGRPSDVGASGLMADTRGDRMWRKKLRWPGVECTLLAAVYSIPIYF